MNEKRTWDEQGNKCSSKIEYLGSGAKVLKEIIMDS